MKKTKWKWLSFVLAAGMVLGLMPQGALAAEESNGILAETDPVIAAAESVFLSAAEEEEIVTLGDGPAYEYTAQPGGDYGVVVVDERNQNKSKGKVSFALDFDPTAVEIIDFNTKTVVWQATKNQVKNNGKTWTDIEIPASESPYQVRAWYINPKDNGPEFAGSYQFRVTNCIRNVQVINVGNVQTDEDFVYGSFDDMVTYGANYKVKSIEWLVYDRSDNLCDPTSALDIKPVSKEGDVIRCEKGKKYRLKIKVEANEKSVFEKTDPNQGIQIGENKQFEMVLVNAGGWEVSTDYSGTTADNMLEIVTEPIDAGEEYRFTEQPASLTTVEPDAANKGAVIRWKVNFPQKKVRVYFGNPMENTTKFTEVEGDFNNIGFNVHGSAKGKELRLRSYYGDGDGDYVESQAFRIAEVIREVSIGGLVRPEEGAAPQTKDSFVIDEDAPYTLGVAGWIKGGSSDAVTKFERPGSYYACFVLSPKPGYIFDATNNSGNIKSVKINGKKELADQGGCLSLNKGNTLEVYSTAFTLNEQWTATFDANGGTGTMEALKVDKGKELTLPWCDFTAPAATSVFEGW
ncbi:MAG: hypothetical protein K5696_00810, partial [Lachnospiraceae bacterium]|nr:hypothetical protein [Lachnospiraceae bacterium]